MIKIILSHEPYAPGFFGVGNYSSYNPPSKTIRLVLDQGNSEHFKDFPDFPAYALAHEIGHALHHHDRDDKLLGEVQAVAFGLSCRGFPDPVELKEIVEQLDEYVLYASLDGKRAWSILKEVLVKDWEGMK